MSRQSSLFFIKKKSSSLNCADHPKNVDWLECNYLIKCNEQRYEQLFESTSRDVMLNINYCVFMLNYSLKVNQCIITVISAVLITACNQ